MNRDMERHKEFSRRALILGAGKVAIFGTLGLRLAYLQIFERQKFQTLSDKNRISLRLLPAQRGEIMDRFGAPLAVNKQDFRALLVPEQAEDVEETLARLAKLIPISDEEKEEVLAEIEDHHPFAPVLVKENLTWDDMAKVELNLPDLAGVSMEEGQLRSYPLGTATAHIIGYVGRVDKAEMTDDPAMSIPGFRIGKTGVEKKYDETLRGEAGQVQAEVNVVGREIRELSHSEGKRGHRLTLTLDSDLQMQCQEYVARQNSAAAVVMDVHTGEVYALCSYPSFDPNVFSTGIPADLWEELLADPTNPLTNKAVAGQYPPGSTFKMVTAMAGLESGAINVSTRFYCPGYYMLGDRPFHCWKHSGHGSIDVVGAIRESCDTFFYETGKLVGIDVLAKMAHRMGLGGKLDFDVPGEGAGIIPDRAWKMKHYKQKWEQGETIVAAIGQGYVLATPLQLVTMTARIANGGKAVKPILVRSIEDVGSQIPEWPMLGFHKPYLDLVHKGMTEVVNDPRGTARASAINEAPYSMAGKTGSAQVRRITAAQRSAGVNFAELPWKFRDHALFVGYGPVDDPAYAVAVIVEHGLHGGSAAAPIAHDILLAAQKRDPRRIRTVDDTSAKNVTDDKSVKANTAAKKTEKKP